MSRTYRFLAIDPGTNCGYSWLDVSAQTVDRSILQPLITQSGVWDLSMKRHESAGMRGIKLKLNLNQIAPDIIFYEEVSAHKGTQAAHVYGGLVQTITTFAAERGIEHHGIPVGTIKKHATGKGNSGKDLMIAAANEKFAIDPPLSDSESASNKDDNIADAMWIMKVALDVYANGLDFNAKEKVVIVPTLDDIRLSDIERAVLNELLKLLSPDLQGRLLEELKERKG